MHELLRVARTVYECASATDAEAIRNMLAVHCAERMGEDDGAHLLGRRTRGQLWRKVGCLSSSPTFS